MTVRKLCAQRGCSQLVIRGRCAEHQIPPSPQKRAHWTPQHQRIRRALITSNPRACCAKCGTVVDLTVDYVVPLVRGGRMTIENAQVLCRTHNSSKGAR